MAPGLIFLALHFSVTNHVMQRKVCSHTSFLARPASTRWLDPPSRLLVSLILDSLKIRPGMRAVDVFVMRMI
jgi:hypothetical protein